MPEVWRALEMAGLCRRRCVVGPWLMENRQLTLLFIHLSSLVNISIPDTVAPHATEAPTPTDPSSTAVIRHMVSSISLGAPVPSIIGGRSSSTFSIRGSVGRALSRIVTMSLQDRYGLIWFLWHSVFGLWSKTRVSTSFAFPSFSSFQSFISFHLRSHLTFWACHL